MESNQQIIDMLKSRTPYTQIQAKFGVSSKTIAAIAKNAGIVQRHHDKTKVKESKENEKASPTSPVASAIQVLEPAVLAENAALREKLRFLNEFFKTNAKLLFTNADVRNYIKEYSETFNEVEKLCQA
jgi:Zn-dependent peptidase ImmA (M78 family)